MNPNLSIIILNYNTKELLRNCLTSLEKVRSEVSFEIIVSDNASSDGSQAMVEKEFPQVKLVKNEENLGFAAGNNRARPYVHGEYVLILNSDAEVGKGTLEKSINYLRSHQKLGAMTCKILLPDGTLDLDARRSFPTPWVSLTHFSGLDRLFPKSKLFSQYWYGFRPANEIQDVDVVQGAFTLARKKALDDVGWYDEDYFLDGEDIDLCWRIKEKGWNIVYFPEVSILHTKKASKIKTRNLKNIMAGVDSMEIFYKKRLWAGYPIIINVLVLSGIKILKTLRYLKYLIQ